MAIPNLHDPVDPGTSPPSVDEWVAGFQYELFPNTRASLAYTHRNIVSKRLCRGLALPEIGEGDVFLCYLPLYHTFGRWLELVGTLWWGATYAFARSTVQSSLLEDFRQVRPTAFISVPKKWMELHEAAVWEAASDDPDDVSAHLRTITGGRLRYGISAAGYLDPAVFRAFHQAGTELGQAEHEHQRSQHRGVRHADDRQADATQHALRHRGHHHAECHTT